MNHNRSLAAFCGIFLWCTTQAQGQQLQHGTLDRKAIVRRHNFHLSSLNEPGPTQVGNGNFAYGFDITGMQTFRSDFTTMSQWSWHSTPPPQGLTASDFTKTPVNTNGRMVPYDLPNPAQPELTQWLAANPHRFNLGRIGLWLKKKDGSPAVAHDLTNTDQQVDLWTGVAVSHFEVDGQPVTVTTVGDPYKDIVAFRIASPLIAAHRLGVFIDFPYASLDDFSNGSDDSKPNAHSTVMAPRNNTAPDDNPRNNQPGDDKEVTFQRSMDSTHYQVAVRWNETGQVEKQGRAGKTGQAGQVENERKHRYLFIPAGGNTIEYVFCFDPSTIRYALPSFTDVQKHSQTYWPGFWRSGGCIDLSQSRDSRWRELERRIVLSQYLMKLNASGKYPPQETGLVSNSWYGRFHYEMIWWHTAHYALWDRWPLLDNCLHVYRDNLGQARNRAALQGYAGARFPKCTGPDGREWPHEIHSFLIWQQPHPIFFAYLDYRAHPTKATLGKWSDIIEASGDFIASYPVMDTASQKYILGPPISFVPEINNYYKDRNPAFELGYWRFALRTAQFLRKQQGLPEKPLWKTVAQQLAPIPQKDGLYEQWENIDSMWTRFNYEHPALLGIYGMLPGDGVDTATMRRTFQKVMHDWRLETGWGWDFPLAAMTAARLGEPGQAIDMLLYPAKKNGYDAHGFVGGGNPYPYIPTNGGLLYAVAMMAAGWDGDGHRPQPGFPADGSWVVKWENLKKAP